MLPDRVSNPGPLTYESAALLIALRGPAHLKEGMGSQRKYSVTQKVRQGLEGTDLYCFFFFLFK